jgi:hypothetical protein
MTFSGSHGIIGNYMPPSEVLYLLLESPEYEVLEASAVNTILPKRGV